MAISDGIGVRHVRCPKCHSVLQEPSVPVYQCGGCGTSLRAKIRTGDAQEAVQVVSAPASESALLPHQSRHLGSSDVASTSASTPDAPSTRPQGTGSHCETGDLVSARSNASEQAPLIVEKRGHDRSGNREADGSSEPRRGRDAAGSAERGADAPNVSATFSRESSRDADELQDSEKRREAESEADGARKKVSGEAARPRSRDLEEVAATSARTTGSQPARDVLKMSPLHEKILKTVDELKGDLSELFSKSQEVKPRTPARPPRLPKQEGHVSRPAIPTSKARHAAAAAAVQHRGSAGYVGSKHGQAAPRGLPSRRYRLCRAEPCGHNVRPAGPCRHSCCGHGKPKCSSCRGHCCGSRAQGPAPAPRQKPPDAMQARRREPPRHHCLPVLKGAPFIVCSSCFALVQVPAGFAVSRAKVSKLRCGSCSAVLSYSYRDPDRKKLPPPVDRYSTDGSDVRHGEGEGRRPPPDLFSFIDDFAAAHGASYSYSTEDEQPLHVSRNSSFTTVGEINTAETSQPQSTSLHRLMGYGSASELLLRRSPSLYESFDRRSTSPSDASRQYHDRKGKGVCVDADDVVGDDDSDEEYGGALKRWSVRGAGWTLGKGVPGPGAIRIRS